MNAVYAESVTAPESGSVIFFFSGYLNQSVIANGAQSIRSRLVESGARSAIRQRLVSAFVELAQNVVHYSADAITAEDLPNGEVRFGSLCVTETDGQFDLMCTNPMRTSRTVALDRRLADLREMEMAQIRTEYLRMLHARTEAHGKGAGLGLLTLAQAAAKPIGYSIEFDPAWGEDYRILYLKVTI